MSVTAAIHGSYVHRRRVGVLARHLSALLPPAASVLDVGCGDGAVGAAIGRARPDLRLDGLEVAPRGECAIPVRPFDGRRLPEADSSRDVVMMVDVLHHTDDPMVLLREARRVARRGILIKDHNLSGFLAGPTLRFMDRVGNARHGVALPYNYWPPERWRLAVSELAVTPAAWIEDLGLYPWPARWLFERSLHFVALLTIP